MATPSSPLPFEILPHELLIDVLLLARPSPQLAAASRVVSCQFQGDDAPQPGRLSWIHQVIFASPVPEEVVAHEFEPDVFGDNPDVRQVQSRLSCFLKNRLPWLPAANVTPNDSPFACALAPDSPLPDPILTTGYLDWVFAGPMRRCVAPYRQQHDLLAKRLDELFVPVDKHNDDASFMDLYASPERAQPLKHMSWTLVPDAFQLVAYFIRAGQTELLRHIIIHLLRILPSLATESHPLSRWVQLAMDNRNKVRSAFAHIRIDEDPPLSFGLFLATLAALDWSLPALHVIQDVLSFDPAMLVAWITTWPPVFRGMMYTLHNCTSASRASQVMQWLADLGFTYDLEENGDISTYAGDCSVFLELFLNFDVPKLAQLAEDPWGRHYLGQKMVEWIAGNADMPADTQNQLLELAAEHDLLDSFVMGRLMWDACMASDKNRQAWVVQQNGSIHDMIQAALLCYTPDVLEKTACQAATLLLNYLIDANMCPTKFIIDVSSSISTSLLSIILFESQPRTSLDLARFTVAWLNRFHTQPDLHQANRPNAERIQLLGKLLIHVICKQHAASKPYLLTDPSVDAQSLACAVAAYFSHLILGAPHAPHHLDAQADIVPNIMSIACNALAGQLSPAPPPSDSPFNSNLFPCISSEFQAAIRSITTTASGLDPAMARFLFDQIYALDPVFAKQHVCMSKDTCVWAWLLYSPDELTAMGSTLKYHYAVSALRRAGEAGDKGSVVAIFRVLPNQVRETRPFLTAVASLNATSPVVAAGLKECGWDWEAARKGGSQEGKDREHGRRRRRGEVSES